MSVKAVFGQKMFSCSPKPKKKDKDKDVPSPRAKGGKNKNDLKLDKDKDVTERIGLQVLYPGPSGDAAEVTAE